MKNINNDKLNHYLTVIFANILKIESQNVCKIPNLTQSNYQNWDSINHMNLILEIEKKFKISLTDNEVIKMISYKDCFTILTEKII